MARQIPIDEILLRLSQMDEKGDNNIKDYCWRTRQNLASLVEAENQRGRLNAL